MKLTNKPLPLARIAQKKSLQHPETGELIDEGIVIWFKHQTATQVKIMVEFHVHGSKAVVDKLNYILEK